MDNPFNSERINSLFHKNKEKIELILLSEVLDMRNGEAIMRFNNDGDLMQVVRNEVVYKRDKKGV